MRFRLTGWFPALFITVICSSLATVSVGASPRPHRPSTDVRSTPPTDDAIATLSMKHERTQEQLLGLYRTIADQYDIDWALLVAIDRFGQANKSSREAKAVPVFGYCFPSWVWAGTSNPNPQDVNPSTIRLFGGLGVDADHDGLAAWWQDEDRIAAIGELLDQRKGEDEELDAVIRELFPGLPNEKRILKAAEIFRRFGMQAPSKHCFPVSRKWSYSVKYSFGAGRSYGGRRMHEGVDIFASYGTPVLASSYGFIEQKGWNRFGGWRIGIRDVNNTYYYYAHLSSYAKGLNEGDIVEPGRVIGYVGSSGYGPPGTSGKFPPHLHFGIYQGRGNREWAYNPGWALRIWERQPQRIITP